MLPRLFGGYANGCIGVDCLRDGLLYFTTSTGEKDVPACTDGPTGGTDAGGVAKCKGEGWDYPEGWRVKMQPSHAFARRYAKYDSQPCIVPALMAEEICSKLPDCHYVRAA